MRKSLPPRRSGMALVAVLWIVAALSVLVAGLTYTVRQQIQVASLQRDQISGQALAEAAIVLTMQQLQAETERPTGVVHIDVPYAGFDIAVELAPLNGLIALAGASPELLAAVFEQAGGLPASQASALALDVVLWRDSPPELDLGTDAASSQQQRRLEAVEDLMLIPGIDYSLYARIAPLFSADLPAGSRVNPEAAPPEVLQLLSQGNDAAVENYLAQRASGQPGADTSAFNPAFLGTGGSNFWRLRADVPLEAGKMLRLTQDISLGSYARTAPWRLLRTQRQIINASNR